MEWFRKCIAFWKLAEEEEWMNKGFTQEYYDNWVKKELPGANLEDIQLFLDARGIQGLIKIKDFLARLWDLVMMGDFTSEIQWIWDYFGAWKEPVVKYLLGRWLKEGKPRAWINTFCLRTMFLEMRS